MKNNDELLPCPFCGNKDLIEDYEEYGNLISYWVECPKCEIVMDGETKAICIDNWNKRM